jgi:hypothetical protein
MLRTPRPGSGGQAGRVAALLRACLAQVGQPRPRARLATVATQVWPSPHRQITRTSDEAATSLGLSAPLLAFSHCAARSGRRVANDRRGDTTSWAQVGHPRPLLRFLGVAVQRWPRSQIQPTLRCEPGDTSSGPTEPFAEKSHWRARSGRVHASEPSGDTFWFTQ